VVSKTSLQKGQKQHTTPGIRWSSPTQLLVWRLLTYLWESGRDPEFSSTYGRMYLSLIEELPKYAEVNIRQLLRHWRDSLDINVEECQAQGAQGGPGTLWQAWGARGRTTPTGLGSDIERIHLVPMPRPSRFLPHIPKVSPPPFVETPISRLNARIQRQRRQHALPVRPGQPGRSGWPEGSRDSQAPPGWAVSDAARDRGGS
jgi:hypothetical protein